MTIIYRRQGPRMRPQAISRRYFTSAMGLMSAYFSSGIKEAQGKNICTKDDIKEDQASIKIPDSKLFYWIDGSLNRSFANIAFYINFPQKKEHFVEKAVFVTEGRKTLGVRYFSPSQSTKSGKCPYIIFNNVNLVVTQKYFLFLQVVENNKIKIYRVTLDASKIQQSHLKGWHLPNEMNNAVNKTHRGEVFTTYKFPASITEKKTCQLFKANKVNCFSMHYPLPQIKNITSSNTFEIDVLFSHPDINPDYYMRYFVLTDPVGRLLSIKKRSYNQGNKTAKITLTAMGRSYWINQWGVNPDNVANINDCPYIMLFCENVKNGFFHSHIWLH